MQRLWPACVKPVTLAVFAIALLVGMAEVALRIHHSWLVQTQAHRVNFQQLSFPSWETHHALKPLKSTVCLNPDTHLPIPIRTNSFGLRGDLIAIPKPADVFRILYLGDETVFASEVIEEETFCDLIQAELRELEGKRCEVINAGVPGYCPLLSYLQFQHSLASLQPDLLILNFDMSDVADDYYYRRHTRLGPDERPLLCAHASLQTADQGSGRARGSGLLLGQFFKRRLGLLPADESRVTDQDEIESLVGRYAWTRESRPDWEIYISQTLAPIEELHRLASRLSCPLVVTLSPVPWQVSAEAMSDSEARQSLGIPDGKVYDPRWAVDPVIQFLQSRSMAYCDVTGEFRDAQKPEQLFHRTVPRLSRQGHQVFTHAVIRWLTRTRPLDPPSAPVLSVQSYPD